MAIKEVYKRGHFIDGDSVVIKNGKFYVKNRNNIWNGIFILLFLSSYRILGYEDITTTVSLRINVWSKRVGPCQEIIIFMVRDREDHPASTYYAAVKSRASSNRAENNGWSRSYTAQPIYRRNVARTL